MDVTLNGLTQKLDSNYLKNKFAKDALAFSSTTVICQLITLIRGFVIRRFLPPEIMGFWNFIAVVQGFIGTFDLGCIAGASRDLPMMRGKSDASAETRIRSTTLWFTFGQNAVIGILALFYFWWNWEAYVFWERVAGFVAVITFIIGSFYSCYITFYSAAQAYVPLSKILLIGAVVEGISFPLFTYVWGLGGLMTVAVITAGLKGGLFYLYSRPLQLDVRKKLHPKVLKELLSFGFVLRVIDYPNALFTMASLLWVTKLMSIEALALFAMARGFMMQVADISCKAGNVFSMRLLEKAGSGVTKHDISSQVERFLLFQLLVVMPLLVWVAVVVIPFVVRTFIPQYAAANQAFIILLICGFFYVLNSGLTNPWIIAKNLKARGIANIAGLVMILIALAVPWFIFGRSTINDVAYSTVAGYFLYFVLMVSMVGRGLWHRLDSVRIIVSVAVAAIWTHIVMTTGYAYVAQYAGFVAGLKATLIMAGATLLAILPIPLVGLKQAQVFSK